MWKLEKETLTIKYMENISFPDARKIAKTRLQLDENRPNPMLQQYSPHHRGAGGGVTNEGDLQGGTLPEGLWPWAFCFKEDPCLLPPDHGSNGHQWPTMGRLLCVNSK